MTMAMLSLYVAVAAAFLKHSMLPPELLAHLKQLNSQAEAQGKTLAEMALRWILQQKGVTSVLVGASSPEQLLTNMKCVAE